MSCEYGYHCKQCNVSTDTWINRGQEVLSMYVHFWPVIHQMYNVSNGYLEVELMGYRWITDKLYIFLEEHYEHGVELEDEYGKYEPLKRFETVKEKQKRVSPFIGQD